MHNHLLAAHRTGDVAGCLAADEVEFGAAHAGAGRWEEALADADRCVAVSPRWGKAHARRGAALLGLGQAGEAVKAYAAGLAAEPGCAASQAGLASAKAAIREAQARYTAMWGNSDGGGGAAEPEAAHG